tara:strand:+ start:180 stop:488 length:309 start_codon:yes stop_codon:yes gene_type:complete
VAEYIGFLAAILTTASFVPQAVKILRTRQTDGISLTMYAMFTLGVAVWLAYGIMLASPSIIAANFVTLCLASTILILKAKAVLAPPQPIAQGATEPTSAPIA